MPVKNQRKRKFHRIFWPCLAGSLILAGLLAWQLGYLEGRTIRLDIGLPGSATGPAAAYSLDADAVNAMQARIVKLLWQDTGGLANWYQLASRTGDPPAARSGQYLAENQLRYGQFLLEHGEESRFRAWWASFRQQYLAADGTIQARSIGKAQDSMTDPKSLMNGLVEMTNWRDNYALLRLLAQSGSRWPDQKRLADLRRLSDKMLQMASTGPAVDLNAAVPTPEPSLDPAATPTPKPLLTSPPENPEIRLEVLRLASPDLYAMRELVQLDERWQAVCEQEQAWVESGYISDELPLYALAYDPAQQGYLPFIGDIPVVDTFEALQTILHLVEIGRENPRSLSWIRDQVFNQKILYDAYHITQGYAASEKECVAAYAIVARIARIKEDKALYDASLDLLLWHQATSIRSDALSAIFRQDEDGLIQVWASDNTRALLAIG